VLQVVRTDLPRCTLLVCPSSVMSNWETQVEQHVAVSAAGLKVYTYHGPDRNRDPDFLASQDLVITSYSILTQDNVRAGLVVARFACTVFAILGTPLTAASALHCE
jgi:SNF2 family DNA or RNA helicase